MIPHPPSPLRSCPPLSARLLAPAGAPKSRLVARAGAVVLALTGRYSMTYVLVGTDALAVVDVGSRVDVPRVVEAVRWLGRPLSQVRAVVASHLHFDHIVGIEALADRAGCPVAVSRHAVDAFEGRATLRAAGAPGDTWHFLGGWGMQGFPLPPVEDLAFIRRAGLTPTKNPFRSQLLPLDDGAELPGLPGWEVVFAPGHSDDAQCLLHREAGFLVTGDTVRNYLGGEWNPIQVDPEAYRNTRARLVQLPVRTIFPGHGPILEGVGIVGTLRDAPTWIP